MSIAIQIIVGIIAILGALFFLTTGIAMNRAADAVTRANMGSPAIYVGFPLVACALLIADSALNGFSWAHFIEFLLITFLMPVGSSMGSMALGRSMMLAQVRMDPRTMREDLREGSQDVAGQDKNHQHTGHTVHAGHTDHHELVSPVLEETVPAVEKHHPHASKYDVSEECQEYENEDLD